jgi:glycosyltransferase involved in cell wall biosynthesis
MIHIVHVVEPDPYFEWFKKLVSDLDSKNANQEIITFKDVKTLKVFAEDKKVPINPNTKTSFALYLNLLKQIRDVSFRRPNSIFVSQGHKPAFICLVAHYLFNIKYGVIHHVQPGYFQLLKENSPIKGNIHQYIYKTYLKHASFIQSLSLEVYNYLLSIKIEKESIFSYGHGIDFERFKEKASDKEPVEIKESKGPKILMAGRLVWEKNYEPALLAMSIVTKLFPDAQLLIAGTGPDEEKLRRIVDSLDLADNVQFLGWVSNVPKLMVECDVFLHLALTESYGQVIIEACLSGIPIVTLPTGVSIDLNKQGDPLLHLISSPNPESIATQLVKFFSNPFQQSTKTYDPYVKYREHNQDYIIDKISDYLKIL